MANSSLFSPFSPCVRRTDHSLLPFSLLLLLPCPSSSVLFVSCSQSKTEKKGKKQNKKKKRKNIIHLVIVHLSQEGSLCSVFPSLRQKRQTRCNKNLLTLYTLLYIDCTRISNITHPRKNTRDIDKLLTHGHSPSDTHTIARHWTYTKRPTHQGDGHCVKIAQDGSVMPHAFTVVGERDFRFTVTKRDTWIVSRFRDRYVVLRLLQIVDPRGQRIENILSRFFIRIFYSMTWLIFF